MARQNQAFAQEHQDDTNEQLLEYLRQSAASLGYTPNACEIIGGKSISARFGGWRNAVQAAGLKQPDAVREIRQQKLFREEYHRQAELFRQEWSAQKQKKGEAQKQRERIKVEQQQMREEQERSWEAAHRNDSDEQLLEYLRERAAELGHTPMRREVEGSTYIAQRFVCWTVALTCAGLPLPQGVKPLKPAMMKAYLEQHAAREQSRSTG
ncbi:MAG: homing endonuclease associated repeat-containing protein [Butyricicoccus sp.]